MNEFSQSTNEYNNNKIDNYFEEENIEENNDTIHSDVNTEDD
jgi:hypothetical protein